MRTRFVFHRLLSTVTLLALLLPLSLAPSLMVRQGSSPSAEERLVSPAADTSAPAAITNLVASTGVAPGTVELSWVAPGDDATIGTAANYIVRYNTSPITDANWDTSTDVSGEPTPGPAGSVEGMIVSGLTPGQQYYFAIKTQDEASNTSGISNSPLAMAGLSGNAVCLPLVSSASGVPTVIPDTTEVLTETTTQYLSEISSDGAVFTFTQSTPALGALAPGDVMVGEATANAPYGFLRKVTSVSSVGGQVVVETEAATLEDAIESGAVHVSQSLTPDQVRNSAMLQGVSLARAQSLGEFYFKLKDVVLYDDDGNLQTTDDQITANGSIRLEPRFDFSLVVRHWELEELSFTTSVDEEAEIEIKTEIEGTLIKREIEIARYYFQPITVMVGWVPVVIVPVLTVNVGVDGSVHVGVSTGVTQEATFVAGLRYADNSWSPVAGFSNEFHYNPPALSAGLDLKGYAGVQLSLLLYGVTGPYAEVNAYLKLHADTSETPWWRLYGGLEIPVGVKVEVLSRVIASYEATVIDYKLLLAQAQPNTPPNLPASPTPEDRAIVGDLNVDLSWTGGDPDGDGVTYDVYFEADDSTPDVLVSKGQDSLSYDPGTLAANTHYYWRVVARDEHGATTAGPVWEFTTATGATCPISLTLQSPQVSDLTVTVDGSVTSSCSTITRLNWQWGDGTSDDQWFPAKHTYEVSGTYLITATAYNDLGGVRVETTTVNIGRGEWILATDFRLSPDQENPNPDSYGHTNVWYFMQSSSLDRDPQNYSLLPYFTSNAFLIQGLEQWHGTEGSSSNNDLNPSIGINATGTTQYPTTMTWPPNTIRVHPTNSKLVIIGWRSPINGSIVITGSFSDIDATCGDGILWYIDKGATNLAYGSLANGGEQNFQEGVNGDQLSSVTVSQGEFIYFIVHPNSGWWCDSTGVDITISRR